MAKVNEHGPPRAERECEARGDAVIVARGEGRGAPHRIDYRRRCMGAVRLWLLVEPRHTDELLRHNLWRFE